MDIRKMIQLAKTPPLGARTVVEGKLTLDMPGVEFCKGLVPDRVRESAERAHTMGVLQKHGINGAEHALMGEPWCVRLVNARRAVERGISFALSDAACDLRRQGYFTNLAHPVALPPFEPYRGPHATLQT